MGRGGDGSTMSKVLKSYLLWSMNTLLPEVKQGPFLEGTWGSQKWGHCLIMKISALAHIWKHDIYICVYNFLSHTEARLHLCLKTEGPTDSTLALSSELRLASPTFPALS